MTSISSAAYFLCWIKVLSAHSSHCRAVGCRMGGGAVILGEMDVARVNPYRSGQSEPPVHMAWFAPHRPATVTESSSAVALKSKAFTFTSFFFHFSHVPRSKEDRDRSCHSGSLS